MNIAGARVYYGNVDDDYLKGPVRHAFIYCYYYSYAMPSSIN